MAIAKHENELCFHGHQLQLLQIPATKSFTCKGCKERGIGHRYRCSETCAFNLHKECFQPPLTLHHPHFPGHAFHFLLKPPTETRRFCDACGKRVLGYVYHCKEGGWDLHPCCRDLPRNIRFSDGPELSLREDTIGDDRGLLVGSNNTKACFRCKRATLQGTKKGVPAGWSYVSECGVDRCHVYCMMKWLRKSTARLADSRPGGRANTNRDESWWETLTLSLVSTTTEFMLGDPTGIMAGMLSG